MNKVEANTYVVYVGAVMQHTTWSIGHLLYMNSSEVCTKARSNEKHKNISVVCCIIKKVHYAWRLSLPLASLLCQHDITL